MPNTTARQGTRRGERVVLDSMLLAGALVLTFLAAALLPGGGN